MKNFLIPVLFTLICSSAIAQPSSSYSDAGVSFIDFQKKFTRPDQSFKRKEDTLRKQFAAKKLTWPAKYVYIRSFKYDSELEVWVKNDLKDPFKLFKTYKVCALAGTLGPKRMEGDYQVPEGFYYINEFNPNSNYYLSLGINYPNVSDRILSDQFRPGGDIYIHGSCVTVGCIPVTDEKIDELYIIAAHAKSQGQDYIPVHIFPIRYNVARSISYLNGLTKDDASLKKFAERLEDAFDYFEKYRQLPVVLINDKGDYIVNEAASAKKQPAVAVKKAPKPPMQHRTRTIAALPESVHQWPEYADGADALMSYLDKVGKEMVEHLPSGIQKAYVQVEFIVDTDGVPVNFKVLRGMNDAEFIDELIAKLEKMPNWKPAILHNKAVPKKMIQTVEVEAAKQEL